MTSRNDRYFKGGFSGLMIAAAIFCGASAAQAAGQLPAGYTEVECITVTDQEQYINTGFQPYYMTDVEAHFEVPDFSHDNIIYWTRATGFSSFAFITKADSADKTKRVRAYRESNGQSGVEIELPEYLTERDIWYFDEIRRQQDRQQVHGQRSDRQLCAGIGDRAPAEHLLVSTERCR